MTKLTTLDINTNGVWAAVTVEATQQVEVSKRDYRGEWTSKTMDASKVDAYTNRLVANPNVRGFRVRVL